MKPYFQNEEAGITLYHGDCREILPMLPMFDLLLTDPPYGINAASAKFYGVKKRRNSKAAPRNYGHSEWDKEPASFELLSALISHSKEAVVWGGNYFGLPASSCWYVWDKENLGTAFADCELAWTNIPKAVRLFQYRWAGMLQGNMACKETRYHPTQKPLPLIEWCLKQSPDSKTILDPFNGSGTTGVACIRLGRQYTGIEIEERYCEISAKRFEREIAQGKLFDAETLQAAESQTAIPFG